MTRRRSAGACCCPGVADDCNSFQSLCFGNLDPNTWPATAILTLSHQFQFLQTGLCCEVGFVQSAAIGSLVIEFSGVKTTNQFNPLQRQWVGTGTYSYSIDEEEYLIETDPLTGDCLSQSLCRTIRYRGSGVVEGRIDCGACFVPGPQNNCTTVRRNWAFYAGGSGGRSISQLFSGSCCDAQQQNGLPCDEPLGFFGEVPDIELQFDHLECEPANPCRTSCNPTPSFGLAEFSVNGQGVLSFALLQSYVDQQPCIPQSIVSTDARIQFS